MSYSVTQVVQLATDIYADIGSPTFQSVSLISGWLLDTGNLGSLNNKLCQSFYITGDANITDNNGNFAGEEADIYSLMYQSAYYMQQANAVLAGGGSIGGGGSFWTSLAEGDSKVARLGADKIAGAYISLSQENTRLLRLAIHDYQLRVTVPQSVDVCAPYAYPSP